MSSCDNQRFNGEDILKSLFRRRRSLIVGGDLSGAQEVLEATVEFCMSASMSDRLIASIIEVGLYAETLCFNNFPYFHSMAQDNSCQAVVFLDHALEEFDEIHYPGHLSDIGRMLLEAEEQSSLGARLEAWIIRWKAFQKSIETLAPDHPLPIGLLCLLADPFSGHPSPEIACKYLYDSLFEFNDRFGQDQPLYFRILNRLAGFLILMKEFRVARGFLHEPLASGETALGATHPAILESKYILSLTHLELGSNEALLKLSAQTCMAVEDILGLDHPSAVPFLILHGWALRSFGNTEGAVEQLTQALKTTDAALGRDEECSLIIVKSLATILRDWGKLEESCALFRRLVESENRVYGPDHPRTLQTIKDLHSVRGLLDSNPKP
ncbi:MAG: tetratricopeptide repeat protein [Deltaproteobacteria bacterium]|nr:tetratricopeptide repeat protein [Deltaproteobacteria bacterium]